MILYSIQTRATDRSERGNRVQLWMIRHAEAKSTWETGGTDFDRPLTETGRAAFGALCRRLDARPFPELILHSPRRRAVETAELLRESLALDEAALEILPALGESPRLSDLAAATEDRHVSTIAIVGHQPSMSALVWEMTGAQTPFSPGAVAVIEFAEKRIVRSEGALLWRESP